MFLHYKSICAGIVLVACSLALTACNSGKNKNTQDSTMFISESTISNVIQDLKSTFGPGLEERITTGVKQAAKLWRKEDGTENEFAAFCKTNFIADTAVLRSTFERFEHNLMLINGYYTELNRDLNLPLHLDCGPLLPVDEMFAVFNPGIHAAEDMYKTKLGFVVLLNFPQTDLAKRLADGPAWSRLQWAETRLAGQFSSRVPSEVGQAITSSYTSAESYIAEYNILMGNLLTKDGRRLFPEDLKLISHWGLRDELKAQYAKADGLERQRMIFKVMERIITQEIPAVVINNPDVDWKPESNEVNARPNAKQQQVSATAENNTRYEKWLNVFKTEKAADPYYLNAKNFIERKFNNEREIPEKDVEALLTSVLSSPLIKECGALISKRLGRPLEAFDIWYNGFRVNSGMTEDDLDRIVRSKYGSVKDFEKDLPNILAKLGFSREKAQWLSSLIAVDAARGSGHAMAAGRLGDKAHLRTRIPQSGMNYKGYNIALHELGHNVEQTFSFQDMDHTLLRGVPNTAFTEGFAFVFQSRDLQVLGVAKPDPDREAMQTLDVLWSTYEIAGVALVDMYTWRWMYEHPEATPADLKQAVIGIAKDVWNKYYAPVLGVNDVPLLAIYSHLVNSGLYVPDYPMGHIIAFQVEEYLKTHPLAGEMERMCRIGSVTPDFWMKTAVGAPISTQPMLDASKKALDYMNKK
jgi:hypothetical protein